MQLERPRRHCGKRHFDRRHQSVSTAAITRRRRVERLASTEWKGQTRQQKKWNFTLPLREKKTATYLSLVVSAANFRIFVITVVFFFICRSLRLTRRATPNNNAALSLDAAAHRAQLLQLQALETVLVGGGRLATEGGRGAPTVIRHAARRLRLEDGERLPALLLVLQQHPLKSVCVAQ